MASGDSEDDIPLSTFKDNIIRPSNRVSENNLDSFDNEILFDSEFPTCDIAACNNYVFTLCDTCNILICKDHAEKSICDSGHNLDVVELTPLVNVEVTNPRDRNPTCEIGICKGEVYAACPKCFRFLCYTHLDDSKCDKDHMIESNPVIGNSLNPSTNQIRPAPLDNNQEINATSIIPESFVVEGNRKEGVSETLVTEKRKKKGNKKTIAKKLRNKGEEYISITTKKLVVQYTRH